MIIGTCSLCGGPVETPDAWLGTLPAPATCKNCGAVRPQHGPVIDMERPGPALDPQPAKSPSDASDALALPQWNYTVPLSAGRGEVVHHHHYTGRAWDWPLWSRIY